MVQPDISVLDWGSSKAIGPNGIIFNYTRQRIPETAENPAMAFIRAPEFEEMMVTILAVMGKTKTVGITGLSHSLVPVLTNGVIRLSMVGDDPSLSPKGGLPERIARHYPEEKTKPASAVRKLAALQEHPKLWQELFGKNHRGELKFTTLLSCMAAVIAGNREDFEIFPDEAADLLTGEEASTDNSHIAGRFGLHPTQLMIGNSSRRVINGTEVYVMQDVRAEARVCEAMYEEKLVSEGTWIFGTDTVLKRFTKDWHEGATPLGKVYKDTMRMMGNTGLQHVWPLVERKGVAPDINMMFRYFEKTLAGSTMPTDWLYDPRGENNAGALWKREGRSWVQVGTDDLVADQDLDVAEVVRAYGWGMAGGMYEGMPDTVRDVVLYGGLMGLFGKIQPGYAHVFVEMAPRGSQVYWMELSDSRLALEIAIREEKENRLIAPG